MYTNKSEKKQTNQIFRLIIWNLKNVEKLSQDQKLEFSQLISVSAGAVQRKRVQKQDQ